MHLTMLDRAIIVASLVISLLPAILLARRAGRSTAELFTSGQAASGWLIGVALVATAFSTGTPDQVAGGAR